MLTKIFDSRYHPAILIVLWVSMHSLLFAHFGIRSFVDANRYIQEAKYLVNHGTLEDVRHMFYILPIVLIATFEWLFPDEVIYFLLFQIMLSGIACCALYKAGERIFNTSLAGFFSVIIYLIWWDMIHWNITVMTESLTASTICFIIYFLSRFNGKSWQLWTLCMIMVILFLIRPTGIITIVSIISFMVSFYWFAIKDSSVVKIAIVIGLFVFAFVSANQMFLHWDFTEQYKKGSIVTYMDRIEGQPLYHEELQLVPENLKLFESSTYPLLTILSFPLLNPVYFIKTASLKVWYLISSTRPYYSTMHNVFSLIWLGCIYFCFFVGMKRAINRPIKIFVLTSIFVNCALIAISTVDWDNRFYIPMEPGIVLMAGGGLAFLFKRNKTTSDSL